MVFPARKSFVRPLIGTVVGALAMLGCSGCGSSGITAPLLQASISRTFANLYVLQQVEQGNPRPSLRSLAAGASCQKGTPSSAQSGAGNDWLCEVTYLVAGPSTPVTALYEVNVQTDGCYAADGDGPASVNGSRTITGPHYQQITNPLWLIDGCFDVTR
jgi:ABC-2 type transport system permease protein